MRRAVLFVFLAALVLLTSGQGANTMGGVPARVRRAHPVSDDPGVVVRNLPAGTQMVVVDAGNITSYQGSIPWHVNLMRVADAGVVVPGIDGVVPVAGAKASNTSIVQHPVLISAEVRSDQPSAASSGNQRHLLADLDGALFVRPNGPVTWFCGIQALDDVLLQCQAAPGAGLKLYMTDITVQTNNPGTTGTFAVQAGQGTNCDAGTSSLYPIANTTARWAAPTLSVGPFGRNFTTPIEAPTNYAICVIGATTNTINVQLQGYTAP